MVENWTDTRSDDDARARSSEFWMGMRADVDAGQFWADRIKKYRGIPARRLELALDNLPLPRAFKEAAVAVRALIRAKRKAEKPFEEELALLYWLAAIYSFMLDYAPRLEGPGFRVVEAIPGQRLRSLCYEYSQLGYRDLSLLSKTDVKWLLEAWGEPISHSTLNAIHSDVWNEYETKLIEKKRQREEQYQAMLDAAFAIDESPQAAESKTIEDGSSADEPPKSARPDPQGRPSRITVAASAIVNRLTRIFGKQETMVSPPISAQAESVVPTCPREPISPQLNFSQEDSEDQHIPSILFEMALREKDYSTAASLAHDYLVEIPNLVARAKKADGSFNLMSIPTLEKGGTVMAVLGKRQWIAEMRKTVEGIPELRLWLSHIEAHERDLVMVEAILKTVGKSPDILQRDISRAIGASDRRRPAQLLSWLEKARLIRRQKCGKQYQISLMGSSAEYRARTRPPRQVPSHRVNRQKPEIQKIDFARISCFSLPRAPAKWELSTQSKRAIFCTQALFELQDTAICHIGPIAKLSAEEKPDPAFRKLFPVESGVFVLDDLGNAIGSAGSPANIQKYDSRGQCAAQISLEHDTYRVNANPSGHGIIAMSRGCILHSYDEHLNLLFQTALHQTPEITDAMRRLDIEGSELKNHIRCVAMSRNNAKYLFSIVDEVWCVDCNGNVLWGSRLPLSEGWTRISARGGQYGNEDQIQDALKFMGLSLPLSERDVKRRYRLLAKESHPDRNPDDPDATRRTRQLISAVELLSGVDLHSFNEAGDAQEDGGEALYSRSSGESGIWVGAWKEKDAADWIYAAGFSAASDTVYIAGYSGRIILLNELGMALNAFDIGAVPRKLIDAGNRLYILTDTRLYVLGKDRLVALVDVHDGGELLCGPLGFGLLEKKRFRWFNEDGIHLGSVLTDHPIRRVYYSEDVTVIETRLHRALISGIPIWSRV